MIKYKVEDYERLEKEYGFRRTSIAGHGDVMYYATPNSNITIYLVLQEGVLMYERNSPMPKFSRDFETLEKWKYQMLEDYMKASRLVNELEFQKIIVKSKDAE